ncbi:hypothetical protein NDU88_002252 [Pleurodeles waltl]|uniref:Uncharacterized protein n=1 Tax=Pleurodeles waltl TaxID=8319 RepID=A0AAV7WN41_PLEWA|nr:hypothetical protein NDU88_002252 [Pleurodeles waltl]
MAPPSAPSPVSALRGLLLWLGSVSRPAVSPHFSLNRPVRLRLRLPLPALRSPLALFSVRSPLSWVALSVSVALTGSAHLCLGGRAGFSLRGSPGSRLRLAQRQHIASQARPTPGPTGSWPPLLRRVALSISVAFSDTGRLSDAPAQFPD